MTPSRIINADAGASTHSTGGQVPLNAELQIELRPWGWRWFEYKGSRAQLEAEGVIPAGTKWPEGASPHRWEADGMQFMLCRTRPAGLKGPMRLWINGDYWIFRSEPKAPRNLGEEAILKKRAELLVEIYLQSPAGRSAHEKQWRKLLAAREDEAFQAFKALFVPERKKPGRKPKRVNEHSGPGVAQ